MTTARFLIGDVFDVMATLPDQSVDLVLTSPPFLAIPAGDLVTTRCRTCRTPVTPGHTGHDGPLVDGEETFWCEDCAEAHCPCNQPTKEQP